MLSVFEKLGVAVQVKGKLKQTPSGVFVGTLIATGETEIGETVEDADCTP